MLALFVLFCVCSSAISYDVPYPKVSYSKLKGFVLSIPDDSAIDQVIIHGSIKQDSEGPGPKFHSVITKPKQGKWTYVNRKAKLRNGDEVNYSLDVYREGSIHTHSDVFVFDLEDKLRFRRSPRHFAGHMNNPFPDEYGQRPRLHHHHHWHSGHVHGDWCRHHHHHHHPQHGFGETNPTSDLDVEVQRNQGKGRPGFGGDPSTGFGGDPSSGFGRDPSTSFVEPEVNVNTGNSQGNKGLPQNPPKRVDVNVASAVDEIFTRPGVLEAITPSTVNIGSLQAFTPTNDPDYDIDTRLGKGQTNARLGK